MSFKSGMKGWGESGESENRDYDEVMCKLR